MLRYDRAVKRLERRWRRDAMLEHLYVAGPAVVYSGLLAYAFSKNFKKPTGWVAHSFREIFGDWPRQRDYGPPQTNPLIEEWAALRLKRKRK